MYKIVKQRASKGSWHSRQGGGKGGWQVPCNLGGREPLPLPKYQSVIAGCVLSNTRPSFQDSCFLTTTWAARRQGQGRKGGGEGGFTLLLQGAIVSIPATLSSKLGSRLPTQAVWASVPGQVTERLISFLRSH